MAPPAPRAALKVLKRSRPLPRRLGSKEPPWERWKPLQRRRMKSGEQPPDWGKVNFWRTSGGAVFGVNVAAPPGSTKRSVVKRPRKSSMLMKMKTKMIAFFSFDH